MPAPGLKPAGTSIADMTNRRRSRISVEAYSALYFQAVAHDPLGHPKTHENDHGLQATATVNSQLATRNFSKQLLMSPRDTRRPMKRTTVDRQLPLVTRNPQPVTRNFSEQRPSAC